MEKLYFFLFSLLLTFPSFTQNTFHHNLYTNGAGGIQFEDMTLLHDSGYLIAAHVTDYTTYGHGSLLVRTDADGDTLWTKLFYRNMQAIILHRVMEAADHGFFMVGDCVDTVSMHDLLLMVKTDSAGNVQWSKTMGDFDVMSGKYCVQTGDGNYAVAGIQSDGITNSLLLVRMNANGSLRSKRAFELNNDLNPAGLVALPGNGIAVLANDFNASAGTEHPVLLKTDENENVSWANAIFGAAQDVPTSLCRRTNGNFLLAGFDRQVSGTSFVMETDSNGNFLWMKTYSDTSRCLYPINRIAEDNSGFLLTGGSVGAYHPAGSLARFDSSGTSLSIFAFDSIGISTAFYNGTSYTCCTQGPYSQGNSTVHFFRVNQFGYGECSGPEQAALKVLAQTPTTQTPVFQVSYLDVFSSLAFQVKSGCTMDNSCLSTIDWTVSIAEHSRKEFRIYPQPAHGELTIELNTPLTGAQLEIFDAQGKMILLQTNLSGSLVHITDEQLANGLFFFRISSKEKIITGKLLAE